MRNARIVCNCGCGTQVLINIMRDSAFPMVEINVREHGAKRWRGAMVSGSDALTIASLIIDNVQQESKA